MRPPIANFAMPPRARARAECVKLVSHNPHTSRACARNGPLIQMGRWFTFGASIAQLAGRKR
jgi:hypothetical protein